MAEPGEGDIRWNPQSSWRPHLWDRLELTPFVGSDDRPYLSIAVNPYDSRQISTILSSDEVLQLLGALLVLTSNRPTRTVIDYPPDG